MANQLLTISQITNRALPVLANQCVLTDKFNRQYDKEFGVKGKKIGGTCNVPLALFKILFKSPRGSERFAVILSTLSAILLRTSWAAVRLFIL